MIPFIWLSGKDEIIRIGNRSVGLGIEGKLDYKRTEGENFWGDRSVQHHYSVCRYTVLWICPNPWKCTQQRINSSLCTVLILCIK